MNTPKTLLDLAEQFIHALVMDGSIDPATCIHHQFRSPSTAHRYSTAYHITEGLISLDRIRQHPVDNDGNVWFRSEWQLFTKLEPDPAAYLDAVIRCNAASLSQETWTTDWNHFASRAAMLQWPRLEYALEGYPEDSPQRHPNLQTVPVSKHVSGMAVDIRWHLNGLNNLWDPHIDTTANQFGLHRPYGRHSKTPEYWHFELLDED